MRYLSFQEVISLHPLLTAQTGGSSGLRDRGALESAVAQPEASFGGHELYPDLASKAAALAHSLKAVDYSPGLTGCQSSILLPSGSNIQAKRP